MIPGRECVGPLGELGISSSALHVAPLSGTKPRDALEVVNPVAETYLSSEVWKQSHAMIMDSGSGASLGGVEIAGASLLTRGHRLRWFVAWEQARDASKISSLPRHCHTDRDDDRHASLRPKAERPAPAPALASPR